MKKWKLALGLLAIFIAGGLTGSLITGRIVKQRIHRTMQKLSTGDLAPIAQMTFKRMRWKLNLTKEQEQPVKDVVREFFSQVTDLRKQQRPQVKELLITSIRSLKPILTPEQFKKLRETIKNRKNPSGVAITDEDLLPLRGDGTQ
jgi:Spy/CpxP family protein refolding chaperone